MRGWSRFGWMDSSFALAASVLVACSAGNQDGGGNASSTGGATTGPTTGGNSAAGAGDGTGGTGASTFVTGSGGAGGSGGGPIVNPCGTGCGPVEICGMNGKGDGFDNDCDGVVDEDCACGPGDAESCFMGDSSFLSPNNPTCHAGTQSCTENGTWGPCYGGQHATDDPSTGLCYAADQQGCHPINSPPFAPVDLASGAGNFDDDAMGTGMYEVDCPMGVSPCPVPNGTSYTPLQSGEYTVHYTKVVNGQSQTCDFPLYVGARGLRVELSWDYTGGSTGSTDLDLHLKKPMSAQAWNTSGTGAEQDCGWGNCKAYDLIPFAGPNSPHWFPDNNVPPNPVNWYKDPVYEANTCYFAPRGAGETWAAADLGCYNPRLDLDNISCDPAVSDPTSGSFCAPENINVDFPPQDQWMRVAVHLYGAGHTGPVRPNVKIFCDGVLASELGSKGIHDPSNPDPNAEAPFAWTTPADVDKVWLAADVLFRQDECVKQCLVEPIYLANTKDPVVVTETQAQSSNGPPYPPIP